MCGLLVFLYCKTGMNLRSKLVVLQFKAFMSALTSRWETFNACRARWRAFLTLIYRLLALSRCSVVSHLRASALELVQPLASVGLPENREYSTRTCKKQTVMWWCWGLVGVGMGVGMLGCSGMGIDCRILYPWVFGALTAQRYGTETLSS